MIEEVNKKFNTRILSWVPALLRWVTAWIYFSAFWRRVVLVNKLDADLPSWVGIKFNHFLPNALFIQPLIEHMVERPNVLEANMIVFTLIEGAVGLALALGLFGRLAGLGSALLALGILLGAGWLGTTCLDEWQIGVFGITSGWAIFWSGSGAFSLDSYIEHKHPKLARQAWFQVLGGLNWEQHVSIQKLKRYFLFSSLLSLLIMLGTNQYFHGGLWGPLHNPSKQPDYSLQARKKAEGIELELMRSAGIDTYGSFIVGLRILDAEGQTIAQHQYQGLAHLAKGRIENHYVAKVKTGPHGLVVPLGARATLLLPLDYLERAEKLMLEDVNGNTWSASLSSNQ